MAFSGSIAFGLVYIPVSLTAATKSKDIGFNLLHKKTGERIRYVKTAEGVGEVRQADIVKGYEYEKGKYVVFEDADFEKLKTPRDKQISIAAFVKAADVDPVYFDKAYYVRPTGGEKAFALLVAAMSETGTAGLAKTVIGTKESLALLRAVDGKMYLSTLFFADEIVANNTAKAEQPAAGAELTMAKQLIETMRAPFEPEQYRDEYRERITAAIESKIAGKEIAAPRSKTGGTVADLMSALKKSLETAKKPARKPSKPVVRPSEKKKKIV